TMLPQRRHHECHRRCQQTAGTNAVVGRPGRTHAARARGRRRSLEFVAGIMKRPHRDAAQQAAPAHRQLPVRIKQWLALDESKRGFLWYLIPALAIVLVLSLYYLIKHRAFAFVDIGIDSFSYYYAFQVAHARQL